MFTSSVSSSSSSTSKVLFHFFLFSLGVVRIRSTTPTTCFTILLVSIYLGTKSARTLYVDSQVVGCTSPVAIRSRSRHGYRKSQPTSSFFIFPSFFQFLTAVTNLPTKSDSLLPQFGLVSFLLIAKSRRAAIDVPVSRFPWLRSFYINNVTILKNIYCRSFGHLVQLC